MKVLKQKHIDEDIVLNKESFYNIVIENPKSFRKTLTSVVSQLNSEEDFFLYYIDDKETELSKTAFFIDNPRHIEVDEKKINTLIQKEISLKISNDKKEEYLLLLNLINEYIQKISFDYPLPLTFDTELTLQSFLKSISLQVSDDYPSFLDYLISQIKRIAFVLKENLFFIVNLQDYIDEEELLSFVKEMNSLELSFVLLSSHMPLYKVTSEFIIRIDKDLCETHIETKPEKV